MKHFAVTLGLIALGSAISYASGYKGLVFLLMPGLLLSLYACILALKRLSA